MADENDTGAEAETQEAGSARKKLKLIGMIIVGVILVAALSVGGTWFLLSDRGANGDDSADNAEIGGAADFTGPAIYLALQPAFIVNYQVGPRTRFLQLELSLVSRDPAAIDVANAHMPLIRNNLLSVLAAQDYQQMQSVEGKEALVDALTQSVRGVMENHLGRPGIETVLFRSFVMQ